MKNKSSWRPENYDRHQPVVVISRARAMELWPKRQGLSLAQRLLKALGLKAAKHEHA